MDCESSTLISSFGMVFFAMYAIGNTILPPLADKYGRKKVFMASQIVCMC